MKNSADLAVRPRAKKTKRLCGHWDLTVSPLTLGGLLTFSEELLLIAQEKSCDSGCDIVFTGELNLPLISQDRDHQRNLIALTKINCANNPFLLMLFELATIENIYWSPSPAITEILAASDFEIWPSANIKARYRYGTTQYVQDFFSLHGQIPFLSVCPAARTRALDFYIKYLKSEMAVVVHLKNIPSPSGQSNANLQAWFRFFAHCNNHYKAKFILIGNDEPGEQIRELANVVVAGDDGADLGRDLALIETALFFMGMASGPCNMAIFSKVPYVIFKNPEHHRPQMQKEIGPSDHFIFSQPLQKLLRVEETEKVLIREWENFITKLPKQKQQSLLINDLNKC